MSSSHRLNALVSHLAPRGAASSLELNLTPCSSNTVDVLPDLKYVQVQIDGRVGIVRLNRPQALNALSDDLIVDVNKAFDFLGRDEQNIGCIILTGNGKAFAAGADIKEMKDKSFADMLYKDKIAPWEVIAKCRIPVIAAVNGFALGGGCEIAMMCDIMIASEQAKFGQPEIKIGTIPGAGGTQRLTRAIGKSKAMEMMLTGRMMTAQEAAQRGLVSAVLPADKLMDYAMTLAKEIASQSKPLALMTKEAVNKAYETTLAEGIRFERRLFHASFGLKDQKEGMNAFANKQKPNYQHC